MSSEMLESGQLGFSGWSILLWPNRSTWSMDCMHLGLGCAKLLKVVRHIS